MDKAKQAADKAKQVAEIAADKAKERADQKQSQRAEEKTQPAAGGIVFQGTSHDEGRNAQVSLYRDRIERVQERSRLSLSGARQDTEVTPIKSVSSVQAKKDGFRTRVTVFASGNTIEFRFGHDEAQRFKDAVMSLVLSREDVPTPAASQGGGDVYEQLKKLGELRDAGVLSPEEFEAKKAALIDRL
jgi:hypothetical protein